LAGTWLRRLSLCLTGLVCLALLVCVLWILSLEPDDWGLLLPMYLIVLVAHPLAGLAVVASLLGSYLQRERPAVTLILANVTMVALPWLWFWSQT
jgi:hypothetical protein